MLLSRQSDGGGGMVTSVPVWGVAAVEAKSTGLVSIKLDSHPGSSPSY